ncbi:hypothetical protein GUJ93_ZPchr0458g22302 [Zizania palustris]|uniref:Uncharacterized protein n=1 Tax=Zizania palustris TaxID=103762 RepID=A0A8J5RCX0_ZIZPA|nr:hypothetical protein GUJ93_ZPchr0458g22302 [Zizania palustris]
MTRITAPSPPSSPPPPPPSVNPPNTATPRSHRRYSPSPSLAFTPSTASTFAHLASRPKAQPSPKRTCPPHRWKQ